MYKFLLLILYMFSSVKILDIVMTRINILNKLTQKLISLYSLYNKSKKLSMKHSWQSKLIDQ